MGRVERVQVHASQRGADREQALHQSDHKAGVVLVTVFTSSVNVLGFGMLSPMLRKKTWMAIDSSIIVAVAQALTPLPK